MDGNGRWAANHQLPRIKGYQEGAQALKNIIRACDQISISYLTVYAFSLENWARPEKEINSIMSYLLDSLKKEAHQLLETNIQLRIIGKIDYLPKEVQNQLAKVVKLLAKNTGMVITLALSYGSRQEILTAIKKIAKDVSTGKVCPDQIDNINFASYLSTYGLPDPDFMIRTSGEIRLSNFMLWQMAYTEFYFTKVYWPDFDLYQFWKALYSFNLRKRTYGTLEEQVSDQENIQIKVSDQDFCRKNAQILFGKNSLIN